MSPPGLFWEELPQEGLGEALVPMDGLGWGSGVALVAVTILGCDNFGP